ncbi:MAG: DUF58 domain-containing protein [Acidobacteria bacterium]|nr:DUF58 domain-containing protein [Acidobacteriota bacterium]
MLTPQGWLVAVAAMALVVAGRLFGIFELFLVGAGLAALALACVVVVVRTRLRLDIARDLHPRRVHAGTPSRVELVVRNRSSRRTPMMTLRDPVGARRNAVIVLGPLHGDETVDASYRLPTERRGIVRIGPLRVEVSDPFGMASTSSEAVGVTELTVWPAVEPVPALPHTSGDDPMGGSEHANALAVRGDEFYALRPYVVGDDLRRVHWASTARLDELMVRQDQTPWEGRATLLLDTRKRTHSYDSFERAVSATASVVLACARRNHRVRLLTTGGLDTGHGEGAAHVESIMEELSTVELADAGDLANVVAALRRPGSGGSFAAFLGGRHQPDQDTVARLRTSYPNLAVVAFADDDRTPFPDAWQQSLASRRRVARR